MAQYLIIIFQFQYLVFKYVKLGYKEAPYISNDKIIKGKFIFTHKKRMPIISECCKRNKVRIIPSTHFKWKTEYLKYNSRYFHRKCLCLCLQCWTPYTTSVDYASNCLQSSIDNGRLWFAWPARSPDLIPLVFFYLGAYEECRVRQPSWHQRGTDSANPRSFWTNSTHLQCSIESDTVTMV
jgi:hypothetical protein